MESFLKEKKKGGKDDKRDGKRENKHFENEDLE